jgi:uncharacterized protein YkwD
MSSCGCRNSESCNYSSPKPEYLYYSGFAASEQNTNGVAKRTNSEKMADDDTSCDEEEFAKEGLRIHNEYRRKHGVPDLKLSKSVR